MSNSSNSGDPSFPANPDEPFRGPGGVRPDKPVKKPAKKAAAKKPKKRGS